jgi:starvation-inducible outer membrane lipoprotein
MNARLVMFLCATTLLLTGCIRSPIDAKKTEHQDR